VRLASRLGGSLPTRVLLEARGLQLFPVMRGGIQLGKVLGLKGTGTPSALILSLDLLQFRFQQLQAARRGSSETASHRVSRPPAHSPSSHRTVLLASTTLTSRLQSPASVVPAPVGSPSPA